MRVRGEREIPEIVQLVTSSTTLYALCQDGTVWRRHMGDLSANKWDPVTLDMSDKEWEKRKPKPPTPVSSLAY